MRMTPDPFCTMRVLNGAFTFAKIERSGGSPIPAVLDPQTDTIAEFHIRISYKDSALMDQGRGYFEAYLFRARNGQWVYVDSNSRYLGNNNDCGLWEKDWYLRGEVEQPQEQFLLRLLCKNVDVVQAYDTGYENYVFNAYRLTDVGGFSLDYVPITIVYCPPGPDMVAALEQSLSFGTRFTVGQSSAMVSTTGESLDVQALGVRVASIDSSSSRAANNESYRGIELTYFRTQTVTADNQKAIGRRYWGPLGDLFVIARNASFAVVQAPPASGYSLAEYRLVGIEDLLVIPAHELLRPANVAKDIPEDVRRRLLECDPFITKLDRFFPDAGDELAAASNPYASPGRNNRAELLGRWTLNPGSVVSYSKGDVRRLYSGEANELQYKSTATSSGGGGFNGGIYGFGAEFKSTSELTLGYQSSMETSSTDSRTASCLLIRNQNSPDRETLELWYDKIFSTLMFHKPADEVVLQGLVIDTVGYPIPLAGVEIESALGIGETITDVAGAFSYMGVAFPAKIRVGDKEVIAAEHQKESLLRIEGVRPIVDLDRMSAWELSARLHITDEQVWTLTHNRDAIFDPKDLAVALNRPVDELESQLRPLVIRWPRLSIDRLPGLSNKERKALRSVEVMSLHELWQIMSDRERRGRLLEVGINSKRIDEWHDALERARASKTGKLRVLRPSWPRKAKEVPAPRASG